MYQYHNNINAGFNIHKFDDERASEYYRLTKDFVVRVKYYMDEFERLFKEHI